MSMRLEATDRGGGASASEQGRRIASDKGLRLVLGGVLSLAFALRLASMTLTPNIEHPDEVFQVLEPAHRLVFGSGVVPWEFKLGIRSWLFPGVVAGLMSLVGRVSDDPTTIMTAVGLLMILSSLLVVYCATMWGYWARGLPGATCCGLVTATWFDLIYFAPHSLTEVLAAHFLVLGMYLGIPGRRVESWWQLFWSGVCLGFAFVLRFHIGPAIAVVSIFIAGREARSRWLPLSLGGAAVITGAGVLDAVTWSTPFQSISLNLYVNMIDHVSAEFGVQPMYLYIGALAVYWSGAFLLIIGTALLGARRLPAALAAFVAIVFSMSLIPHKEYRFIYPALVFVPIMVGLGTAEIAAFLREKINFRPGFIVAATCAFWMVTSSLLAVAGPYRSHWFRSAGVVRAFGMVSHLAGACGVALRGIDWDETPGQTRLPPNVKLYGTISDAKFAESAPSFNAVVGYRDSLPDGADFQRVACWPNGINAMGQPSLPDVCVWRRDGGCQPAAGSEVDTPWPKQLQTLYGGTCPDGPFCRKDHVGLR
jgi:GPI mannosyltransferase 3